LFILVKYKHEHWTVMNSNFYESVRLNEIEWEWIIFTVHEHEWWIITVHECEQTVLWYAYFQELMRNVWEMTDNEWVNIVHDR
jgi:hypothetical protein